MICTQASISHQLSRTAIVALKPRPYQLTWIEHDWLSDLRSGFAALQMLSTGADIFHTLAFSCLPQDRGKPGFPTKMLLQSIV